MPTTIDQLLHNNREWAKRETASDPSFFKRTAEQQSPDYLFFGCSDSRVHAATLTGTGAGEMFVHRNIANQVLPNDLNALSVLQFAVEVLGVKHVIVCGHYGCGGVRAAAGDARYGLVDHWIGGIRAVRRLHARELDELPDENARIARLVELNVIHQVHHLTLTPVIQDAWAKGRRPVLHGVVYDLEDGLLRVVVRDVDRMEEAEALVPRL